MKDCRKRELLKGLVLILVGLAVIGIGLAQTNAYLNFNDLTGQLRSLANGSRAAAMSSIGTTGGGREIWLVAVANPGGTPDDQRPGVLVVGNLEGDHLLGSQLALETIRHLLNSGDANLDDQVFYVIPRLNPDGAEAMFAAVRTDRTRNARPFDDDNDGRIDEDPAEDLNGDGLITLMRVPDAGGSYMIDPDNPRLMKAADAAEGETGAFKIYWEGQDSDGDGFINEDGPGGVDLNRNFQHVHPYWERDAGYHMVSEPESRALMDFVLAHRNIGAIITYGHSDNLVTPPDSQGNLAAATTSGIVGFADDANSEIFQKGVFGRGGGRGGFGRGGGGRRGGGGGGLRLRGAQPGADNDPSSGRRPTESVHRNDLTYFKAASDAYKEITGIQKIGVNREAKGAFFQYGYYQFGVPSFSTQGWGLPGAEESSSQPAASADPSSQAPTPAQAGRRGNRQGRLGGRAGRGGAGRAGAGGGGDTSGGADSGFDATLLKALEDAEIDGFLDWTSYNHPDLGQVEIGGFRPYVTTNPPASQLGDLGSAHGQFTVRIASMLPRVRIADTQVTDHGGGVFTVEATIENTGLFPTSLQHGIVSRSVQPTTVQIQVDPDTILTGDDKSSTLSKLDGSGSRAEFSWVIQATPGSTIEIRVRSQKGGSDSTTVTLR